MSGDATCIAGTWWHEPQSCETARAPLGSTRSSLIRPSGDAAVPAWFVPRSTPPSCLPLIISADHLPARAQSGGFVVQAKSMPARTRPRGVGIKSFGVTNDEHRTGSRCRHVDIRARRPTASVCASWRGDLQARPDRSGNFRNSAKSIADFRKRVIQQSGPRGTAVPGTSAALATCVKKKRRCSLRSTRCPVRTAKTDHLVMRCMSTRWSSRYSGG